MAFHRTGTLPAHSSGGYEIVIGPLIIDLAIYALLFYPIWAALTKRIPISRMARRIITGFLWLGAAFSLFLKVATNAPRSYFFPVGIQPRPVITNHK